MTVEPRYAELASKLLAGAVPEATPPREEDREAILFDLGLGALQADFCVRISDHGLAARLREYAGRSLFEPGNPAMAMILAANPHRVFISRLGRIEVYQPIPPPSGKSPEGPHTHTCCRGSCKAGEPIPPPNRCLRAGFPARISIHRTRRGTGWVKPGRSTPRTTMPFSG